LAGVVTVLGHALNGLTRHVLGIPGEERTNCDSISSAIPVFALGILAEKLVHIANRAMRTLPIFMYLSATAALLACSSEKTQPLLIASGGTGADVGGSTTTSSSIQAGGNSSSTSTGNGGGSQTGGSQGGVTAAGGSPAKGGSGTAAGGASAATGGATGVGGASTSGGGSSGATSNNGGSTASGGKAAGGTSGSGGNAGTSIVAASGAGGAAVNYMLPPPDQCHDLDQLPWSNDPTTGCVEGNTASKCGGKCQTASVCESPTAKPNADREYMCQRNLLFSPEMEQAAIDDGMQGFHYAVVGHDPDRGGIDGTVHSCCQCYQLVYAYPSPSNDRQAQVNPDNPVPPASAITVPPPLIVQSFNTAATPTTFDVYMPAGGMGAQNGCFLLPNSGADASARKYMYTSYPLDGQPGSGGVKPASLWDAECKTSDKHWVTDATLSSAACVKKTTDTCNKIASDIPGLTEFGSKGCLKANTIDTFYHLNWSVYAMRVECPEHLTRVTGCKLAPQGLKSVKKDVKTAAQASKDSDFWSKTSSTNNLYETTTMEDCCRPTCASYSQISSFGLTTDSQYRSFYNCNAKGVPWTQ